MNKFCKDSSAGEEGAKPTEDDSGKDEEAAATKIQAGFKGNRFENSFFSYLFETRGCLPSYYIQFSMNIKKLF